MFIFNWQLYNNNNNNRTTNKVKFNKSLQTVTTTTCALNQFNFFNLKSHKTFTRITSIFFFFLVCSFEHKENTFAMMNDFKVNIFKRIDQKRTTNTPTRV